MSCSIYTQEEQHSPLLRDARNIADSLDLTFELCFARSR